MIETLIAHGRHGDLNRRSRAGIAPFEIVFIAHPAERVIDDEHPAPGKLTPFRVVRERRRRPIRFLAGAHDIDAFVADITRSSGEEGEIVRRLYAEITR